jgi:hypothetical protein
MGALPNRRTWVLGLGLVGALAAGVGARQVYVRRAAARTPPPTASSRFLGGDLVLRVPHIPGSITLDGDTDDPGWTKPPGPARTGAFLLANGETARPYSDTRMLWGDGHLYLALYAADEDIRSRTDQADGPLWLDDSFRLVFSRGDVDYAIEVSPKGIVTDAVRKAGGEYDYSWSSRVHVSPELDGTLNKPDDMDEEWVIEMALPFESIGLKGEPGETLGFSVKRCDTPKKSARVCAGWEGRLVLE